MFAAADPGRRMMLLGIPALVLIGLYTMLQAGSPRMVSIAIGPGEELPTIELRLKAAGLTDYQIVEGRIQVPVDQVEHYRTFTNRQNPSDKNEWEQQFSKTGIFTTRDQLLAAREIALEKTIRRAILAVPAIADATVTWARSHQRRWSAKAAPVTATVCVTPRPDARVTPQLAQSLQIAVANMVPDLQPKHVTIFDQSTGQSTGANCGLSDSLVARRATEDHYHARIRAALAFIPDANVTVTATHSDVSHDRVARDRHLQPTASANSIPTTSAQKEELHVSIIVSEQNHSTLMSPEAAGRRQRIEQIIRRIVEPSAVLASWDIGAIVESTESAATREQPESSSRLSPAWLAPFVLIAITAISMWWSRRSTAATTLPEDVALVSDEPIIESQPSANEHKQAVGVATETVDSGSDLESVLQTHPHESLSVLQEWTESNRPAAAAVAGRMDPSIAAGFAARMSDDERARMHSALQQPANTQDTSVVNAFCRQVAQAALPAEENATSEPKPLTVNPTRRPRPVKAARRPTSRLYEFPPRLIAQMLNGEQPQTVAIALARLDTSTIDRVLRNFSLAKSSRIRQRLESADRFTPTLSDDVESAVLQRLKSQATTRGSGV